MKSLLVGMIGGLSLAMMDIHWNELRFYLLMGPITIALNSIVDFIKKVKDLNDEKVG